MENPRKDILKLLLKVSGLKIYDLAIDAALSGPITVPDLPGRHQAGEAYTANGSNAGEMLKYYSRI